MLRNKCQKFAGRVGEGPISEVLIHLLSNINTFFLLFVVENISLSSQHFNINASVNSLLETMCTYICVYKQFTVNTYM